MLRLNTIPQRILFLQTACAASAVTRLLYNALQTGELNMIHELGPNRTPQLIITLRMKCFKNNTEFDDILL